MSFITQLWDSHSVISTISCRLYRSALIGVGMSYAEYEYQEARITWASLEASSHRVISTKEKSENREASTFV